MPVPVAKLIADRATNDSAHAVNSQSFLLNCTITGPAGYKSRGELVRAVATVERQKITVGREVWENAWHFPESHLSARSMSGYVLIRRLGNRCCANSSPRHGSLLMAPVLLAIFAGAPGCHGGKRYASDILIY